MSNEVVEFKAPSNDDKPKLVRARGGGGKQGYCPHTTQLHIDEDTQLVTCAACKLQMSAYNALLVISRQWERMHYETTEWRRMKAEQAKASKLAEVKRTIRDYQWVELPEEGDEPARTYWLKVTEALGREPYAIFARRRGKKEVQYCVMTTKPTGGGWEDADFLISRAKRAALEVVSE